jgi:hypothetical protein
VIFVCSEFYVEGAVFGRDCVRIVPLRIVRTAIPRAIVATHLEILRRTVPDVDSFEVRVIAVVKRAARLVELVGKLVWSAVRSSTRFRVSLPPGPASCHRVPFLS